MQKRLSKIIVAITALLSLNLPNLGALGGGIWWSKGIVQLWENNPLETILGGKNEVSEVLNTEIVAKMEKLAFCESGNRDNVVIIDTNGYRSYSRYQFQLSTFRQYAEKYGLVPKGLTNDELRVYVLDGELQAKVVYRMLEEDPKNIYHWRNCAARHQLT